jgi:hypothetical protein
MHPRDTSHPGVQCICGIRGIRVICVLPLATRDDALGAESPPGVPFLRFLRLLRLLRLLLDLTRCVGRRWT